jgi:hypothetical protein
MERLGMERAVVIGLDNNADVTHRHMIRKGSAPGRAAANRGVWLTVTAC